MKNILRRRPRFAGLLLAAVFSCACFAPTPMATPAKAAPAAKDVPNFAVRVKVESVDGRAPAADQKFALTLSVPLGPQSAEFTGNDWSEWVRPTPQSVASALEQYHNSANSNWQVKLNWLVKPIRDIVPVPRLRIKVESAIEGGETSATDADLFGVVLGVLLWKGPDNNIHIDTLAGHGRRVYEPAMKAAYVPENERPKQIVFADDFIAGDSDWNSWKEGIARLAKMGVNTLGAPTQVHGAPADLSASLREAGIHRTWGATYHASPYVYRFSPDKQRRIDEYILPPHLQPLLKAGWKPAEIAFWVIADEPAWDYPAMYQMFNGTDPKLDEFKKDLVPHALNAFHEYLKKQGLKPEDLGKRAWNEVKLIGRDEYSDLPSRRLYYWSNRFLPWTLAHYFAEVTKTYQNNTRADLPVMVNLNNFIGRHYTPNMATPGAATGSFDWLEMARENGVNNIGTEDWFGDGAAFQWSYYASKLRSAADLNKSGFGGLIVPRVGGQRPGGLPQKILSLVGHGAKIVELFTFGPEYNFPVNCYSENPEVFKPLSDGMSLVAKSEDLIYPGQQRRPQVAILTPQSSQLWDAAGEPKPTGLLDLTNVNLFRARMGYMSETVALFLALQHAAVPVQFVDESGLTEASLKNYKVLYITAPDLPAEATAAVLQWVRAGGTLVSSAGAGQFDRYHQPQSTLLQASGYAAAPLRMPLANRTELKANGTLKSGATDLVTFGAREKLNLTDAKAIAAFEDGAPALIEKKLGLGRILHYALYPGLSYVQTADGSTGGLLTGFSNGWRDLITQPIRATKINLPVRVSTPLVEAPALYSEKGVAISLLNWNGEAKQIEVSVAVDKQATRVESALRGKLDFQQKDNRVTAKLRLGDVDVLKIYY